MKITPFYLLYTDPGSGMMLLQILFAFLASILFYFRKVFYKIFKKRERGAKINDSETGSRNVRSRKDEV